MRERLIIALDVSTADEALALTRQLQPFAGTMKIGLQLFTAEGPALVRAIRAEGIDVFLDLKLLDIPNTVAQAVRSAARLDVQMLTFHLSGGREMIAAAMAAAPSESLLLGVTVLTSANEQTLRDVGIPEAVPRQVNRLASLGVECGVRRLVASALELKGLREVCGSEVELIVPGIRPHDATADDQKRTMTPREALAAGADYLVMGRPITAAADPVRAARKIIEDLER